MVAKTTNKKSSQAKRPPAKEKPVGRNKPTPAKNNRPTSTKSVGSKSAKTSARPASSAAHSKPSGSMMRLLAPFMIFTGRCWIASDYITMVESSLLSATDKEKNGVPKILITLHNEMNKAELIGDEAVTFLREAGFTAHAKEFAQAAASFGGNKQKKPAGPSADPISFDNSTN